MLTTPPDTGLTARPCARAQTTYCQLPFIPTGPVGEVLVCSVVRPAQAVNRSLAFLRQRPHHTTGQQDTQPRFEAQDQSRGGEKYRGVLCTWRWLRGVKHIQRV